MLYCFLLAFTNGTLNTDGAVSDVHTISEENEISQEYVLVHCKYFCLISDFALIELREVDTYHFIHIFLL